MPGSAGLTATLEDYLEAISRLAAEKGAARVRDIAKALSVHKSTVTAALKSLAEKKLINYAPYELATLTESGRDVADEVRRRHRGIRDFLINVLCIDEATADANACRLEHAMDKQVFRRLGLFAEFVKTCPRAGEEWIDRFREFTAQDGSPPRDPAEAEQWVARFQEELNRKRRAADGLTDE